MVTGGNFDFFAPFLRPENGENRPRRQAGADILRLGCALGESAVGAVEAELRGPGACVASIAVAPARRGQGLASFMLKGLLRLLRDTGGAQVWALAPSWLDAAAAVRRLYTGAGFRAESEDGVYTYLLGEARRRPAVQKMAAKADDPRIVSLAAAPAYLLRILAARIAEQGGAEDLTAAADLDHESSVFYLENGDTPASLLFAAGAEGLEACWLHGGTAAALSAVVASGVRRALERYGDETLVRVTAVQPAVDSFVAKLLGEPQTKEYITSYCLDL
jgi:GNAT superfamily N-acetyltransferase